MQGFATIANSQAMKAKIVRLQMGKIPNYFVSSVIKWDIWQGRVQMWRIIPGKIKMDQKILLGISPNMKYNGYSNINRRAH